MANRVFLSGRASSVAVRKSEQGETTVMFLEVRTNNGLIHVEVVADATPSINFLRTFRAKRPVFITGELRESDDGRLVVRVVEIEYARPATPRKPNYYGFKQLNPLPLEKFANR